MLDREQLAYTINQALQVIPYSRSGFYMLINQGRIKTFKVGGKRMISARELERFIVEAEEAGEV